MSVSTKVVLGVMLGRQAKDVSPTIPLVTLLTAVSSKAKPKRGATGNVSNCLTVYSANSGHT